MTPCCNNSPTTDKTGQNYLKNVLDLNKNVFSNQEPQKIKKTTLSAAL